MAIITKPAGGILKGVPATITLSKVELAANTLVAADSYFSDSDNWNKILLKYKSSEGRQYEIVEFNGQLASPTGFFSVSEKARDLFEIQALEIIDFDGGIFVVPRGALTTADFDVDFNAEPPPEENYVMWNNTSTGYLVEADGGVTTTASRPSGSPIDPIYATQDGWQTGDFSIEYEVSQNSTSYCYFGMYDTNLNPAYTTGFIGSQIYFLQSPIGSFTKPSGDTYRLKIERIGFSVKFYVNDVLAINATQTEANYDQIKVPFFSIQPNVYIVKTTIV